MLVYIFTQFMSKKQKLVAFPLSILWHNRNVRMIFFFFFTLIICLYEIENTNYIFIFIFIICILIKFNTISDISLYKKPHAQASLASLIIKQIFTILLQLW